jgi:hypothetical protein
MHKNTLKYTIGRVFFAVWLFFAFGKLNAQTTPDSLINNAVAPDSGIAPTAVVDLSQVRIGSGGLDDQVAYTARDSMWFDVEKKQVHLYGEATVTYTSIVLKAAYILLDYEQNTIVGMPMTDSLGRTTGLPEFADKDQKFSAKELRYNFKTKKGLIKEAYTAQENMYILGSKAKFVQTESQDTSKAPTNTIYNENALITTCDHPNPHFGVRARKLKVIPDKLVVVGPSLVEISGIPTPLVLPFGFFPITKTRKHGIILPRDFNLNDPRGLGILDLGYYIPLSQHADLKLNFDYYLRGSHTIGATSRYKKLYKYDGYFDLSYSNNIQEDQLAKKISDKSYSIKWSHSQDQKANPYHKFSGSINLETNQNSRRNNNDFKSVYNNNRNSAMTYNRIFQGKPYSLQVGFSHSQTTSTRRMTVNFPNVDFNLNRIYPFKKKQSVGKEAWYERLTLTYSSKFRNTLSGIDSSFFARKTLDSALYAAEHRASSDLQMKLFKFINIAPRISYQESWYWQTIERALDTTIVYKYDTIDDNGEILLVVDTAATRFGTVRTDIVKGFKPFRTFDAGISANTSLYMTKLFKRGWLRGVRHVLTPSVGFTYTPDFTQEKYDYFRTYQTDVRPNVSREQEYNIFEQALFGRPSSSASPLSISYSLRNVLEMKYFSRKDTTTKLVKLFNNLAFNGSYSLTAKELKWSEIRTASNFNLFKNIVRVNWNLALDPYQYDPIARKRINKFLRKEEGKLFRISNFGISVNAGLSIQELRGLFVKNEDSETKLGSAPPRDTEADDLLSIVNSFRLSYFFGIDKEILRDGRDTFVISRNSFNVSGSVPLTSKWTFNLNNISYDLTAKQLVYPDIGISRDLHCWEMSMSWQPVRGTYTFAINVRPGPLDFLRIPYRKNNVDTIFGN